MKKLMSLILVLSLVFALAACGGKTNTPTTSTPSTSEPSTSAPSTSAPVEEEKKEEVKSADLQAFFEATFSGEDMPALMTMEKDALDAFYAGLTALDLKQCIAAMPMISAVAAEIALVEVTNPEDVQKVQDIFQARIDYQVKEQGAWYPATIEAWEKNSEIVVNGNTVMLIVMDPKDGIVEAFNALFA